MQPAGSPTTLLVAESDPHDRLLLRELFARHNVQNPLHFVEDGEQLMHYLKRHGDFANLADRPLPGLLFVSFNLAQIDPRVALAEIRRDAKLCRIPVIALVSCEDEEKILRTHGIAIDSIIQKPATLRTLFAAVSEASNCWISVTTPTGEADIDVA